MLVHGVQNNIGLRNLLAEVFEGAKILLRDVR